MLNLKKVNRKRNTNKNVNNFKSTKNKSFVWIQLVGCLLIFTILFYHSYSMFQESCNNAIEVRQLRQEYYRATLQLKAMKQKHLRLLARIKRNADRFPTILQNVSFHDVLAPSADYERVRRSVHANTRELWLFIAGIFNRINNGTTKPVMRTLRKNLLELVGERKRWLLIQQEQLLAIDGYSDWREQEAKEVSTIIQRRLWFLQNPHNCRSAKKLVCSHNQGGFGCKHHHLMFCLMYAYATKRVLILNEKHWTYDMNRRGWNSVFYPLSETCHTSYDDKMAKWTGPGTNDARVLFMPVLDLKKALKTKPLLLPYFIPKDLAKRIARFNSDPTSWWAGQMLKYILKPRPHVQAAIYREVAGLNLTNLDVDDDDKLPMVGIHVRWTDKNREAPLFPLAAYMQHVEDYYKKLEMTQPCIERRVYIATDDERVLKQAKTSYPNYKVFGSPTRAHAASSDVTRYTERALSDLLADLYILTMCQYVVATFSSNFGKMAYELMQTSMDATHRFHSIDDAYFMCSTTLEPHHRRAVMRSSKHPTFEIGDIIKHYYFRPDSIGKVIRTQEHGPVPWYKTEEQLDTYLNPRFERIAVYIDDVPSNDTEDFFSFSFDIPRKILHLPQIKYY